MQEEQRKKEEAEKAQRPNTQQGNDWIRQQATSVSVKMLDEDEPRKKGSKGGSGEQKQGASSKSLLPTAEEHAEQRKLERMPWRYVRRLFFVVNTV
jgi:hypothetical protein